MLLSLTDSQWPSQCAHCVAGAITAIRLANGSQPGQGRLEVQYHGAVWGTICGTTSTIGAAAGFDTTAAGVACRQLGFGVAGGAVLPTSAFGPGSGPILLASIRCDNASLDSLADCHTNFGSNGCTHDQDVGVWCLGSGSSAPTVVGYGAGSSATDGGGTP